MRNLTNRQSRSRKNARYKSACTPQKNIPQCLCTRGPFSYFINFSHWELPSPLAMSAASAVLMSAKNLRNFLSPTLNQIFFMSQPHFTQKCGREFFFNTYSAFYATFRVLSLARASYFFLTADIAAALAFSVSL